MDHGVDRLRLSSWRTVKAVSGCEQWHIRGILQLGMKFSQTSFPFPVDFLTVERIFVNFEVKITHSTRYQTHTDLFHRKKDSRPNSWHLKKYHQWPFEAPIPSAYTPIWLWKSEFVRLRVNVPEFSIFRDAILYRLRLVVRCSDDCLLLHMHCITATISRKFCLI